MTANDNVLPPGSLERVLARDRRLIAVALAVLVALAWSYLLMLARQMGDDAGMAAMTSMPNMPDMPGMTAPSPVKAFALAALMWWIMMIGMMLPSAAPMVLLFGNVQRRQLAAESPRLRVAAFTLGYLAVWGVFSLLAAAAQIALTELALLAPMELTATRWLGALLVALAGVYQLTPLKNACLRRCRSPAEFLSGHWRRGTAGALRMGVEHGVYCVGCCWLLMGLLFVVGVMNLLWVAAIAAFVLLEKLVPHGEAMSRLGGAALLIFAASLALGA
jgi:predicted metal-binding membrane protein